MTSVYTALYAALRFDGKDYAFYFNTFGLTNPTDESLFQLIRDRNILSVISSIARIYGYVIELRKSVRELGLERELEVLSRRCFDGDLNSSDPILLPAGVAECDDETFSYGDNVQFEVSDGDRMLIRIVRQKFNEVTL